MPWLGLKLIGACIFHRCSCKLRDHLKLHNHQKVTDKQVSSPCWFVELDIVSMQGTKHCIVEVQHMWVAQVGSLVPVECIEQVVGWLVVVGQLVSRVAVEE